MLELTGVDRDLAGSILKSPDAGVSKIIPHIWSIIDKMAGSARPADVRQLLEMTKPFDY